jgi:hypothetical protein
VPHSGRTQARLHYFAIVLAARHIGGERALILVRLRQRRNHSVDLRNRSGIGESGPSQTAVKAIVPRRKYSHRRHPVGDTPKGNSS